MMKNIVILNVFLFLACIGCSSGGVNPTIPVSADNDSGFPINTINEGDTNHQISGSWMVEFDLETLNCTVKPSRESTGHFNVTWLMPEPDIDVNSYDPVSGIIDVDVTIANPTSLTGYDLRLIVFTDDVGHKLLNPDNWTGLYDIPEGMPINPFKAYAKEWNYRMFIQTSHTENLQIYLPGGNPAVGFAIDVSYPGNCTEPYEISDFTQGFLLADPGSSTDVSVIVKDWQVDVNAVNLYCPAVTGITLKPFAQTDLEKWEMTLINNAGAGVGEYIGYVIADSENSNVSLFDQVLISVRDESGWGIHWGGAGVEYSTEVDTDTDGNIFISGSFSGTTHLDPLRGDVPRVSKGILDGYVTKFDKEGNYLWGVTWGSSRYEDLYDTAVDHLGNVYVTGYFGGNVDLDPGPGVDIHYTHNQEEIFISKFDGDGNYIWGRSWGGSAVFERGHGLFIDKYNDVYNTGYYGSTVDFDPGPGVESHTSHGSDDVYLSKFDSAGDFLWVKTWGGTQSDWANEIAMDNESNVLVSGHFSTVVDFDPAIEIESRTANGMYDAYINKLDENGDFIWVRTLGGIENDRCNCVTVDKTGSVYGSGWFGVSADFDPDSGIDMHYSNGMGDAFLTKYNANGDYLWGKSWGGIGSETSMGITMDASENVIMSGYFEETVDFDPGVGIVEAESEGGWDIFVSKFTQNGNYSWSRTWGDSQNDIAWGIHSVDGDNLLFTGGFQGMVDFDPGPLVDEHQTWNNSQDAYIIKLMPNGFY